MSWRTRKRGTRRQRGTRFRTARVTDIKKLRELKQFTELGMKKSLHWKVSLTNLAEILSTVWKIGHYNEFNPDKVNRAIKKIYGDVSSFEVGREYSPVIYVSLPYWTHQQLKNRDMRSSEGRLLSGEEKKAITNKVLRTLKKANPDELDYDESIHQIRAWWD